jgi:hypothetical protein
MIVRLAQKYYNTKRGLEACVICLFNEPLHTPDNARIVISGGALKSLG